MNEEVHIFVSGRVQGVFFRDYTKRRAKKLNIDGWVKNLVGGSVEIVAQGSKEKLEQFVKEIKNGSLLSKVEKVNLEWRKSREIFDSFEMILK